MDENIDPDEYIDEKVKRMQAEIDELVEILSTIYRKFYFAKNTPVNIVQEVETLLEKHRSK